MLVSTLKKREQFQPPESDTRRGAHCKEQDDHKGLLLFRMNDPNLKSQFMLCFQLFAEFLVTAGGYEILLCDDKVRFPCKRSAQSGF